MKILLTFYYSFVFSTEFDFTCSNFVINYRRNRIHLFKRHSATLQMQNRLDSKEMIL